MAARVTSVIQHAGSTSPPPPLLSSSCSPRGDSTRETCKTCWKHARVDSKFRRSASFDDKKINVAPAGLLLFSSTCACTHALAPTGAVAADAHATQRGDGPRPALGPACSAGATAGSPRHRRARRARPRTASSPQRHHPLACPARRSSAAGSFHVRAHARGLRPPRCSTGACTGAAARPRSRDARGSGRLACHRMPCPTRPLPPVTSTTGAMSWRQK